MDIYLWAVIKSTHGNEKANKLRLQVYNSKIPKKQPR